MKLGSKTFLILASGWLALSSARADERLFTYTYEPETTPKGTFEFEQWVTSRFGRNRTVGQNGQNDYQRWQFREEFEYGVTDNYTLSLYMNHDYEYFKDNAGAKNSRYDWTGISLENKYLVLNPAKHAVGLTLYLEPTYDGDNFELEQKIILGQRYGDWKWALNLVHATEWTDDFREEEALLDGRVNPRVAGEVREGHQRVDALAGLLRAALDVMEQAIAQPERAALDAPYGLTAPRRPHPGTQATWVGERADGLARALAYVTLLKENIAGDLRTRASLGRTP